MSKFWIALAKAVVPFLVTKVVELTETKADDSVLEVVKVGLESIEGE